MGEALLHSLDVRQMAGEPGFFGSYGFDGWAGVGEAKPITVMHELGHSYWGAFPVIGRPDLSWEKREGDEIAPALAAYHRDILAFMAHPPDEYELLRQRLRDLPGLSSQNTEPLFHSMEADVPYTTGGDLSLLPPILRKYWGHFLVEGPFGSWDRAAGWLQSLGHDGRVSVGKFLGFEHMDLRLYDGLPSYDPPGDLLNLVAETLATEERQRLTDLARQFDLLVGDGHLNENFSFWRGYLQDKVALHRDHPEHLSSLNLPRADEIATALSFLSSLVGTPERRAAAITERIATHPFLVNFLPAVDDPTLVVLFAGSPDLPDGPTLHATASFVDRLLRFGGLVDRVLDEGRRSPQRGSDALREFLDEADLEQEHDLQLFFDLLHNADRQLSRRIMLLLENETVRDLMEPVPVQLRNLFEPDGLLRKLDVSVAATDEALSRGLGMLVDEASGNYRIDEPFLDRLYEVMAERVSRDPATAAMVIAASPFPLERFIQSQPAAASVVLSSDLNTAIALVLGSDAIISPPARIIYRLIHSDPALAASLVVELDRRGEGELVAETLAYFAYDRTRSEKFPDLPISLANDGAFLGRLLELQGPAWLEVHLAVAIRLYRHRAASGEVSPHFLEHYRQTLHAAVAAAPGNSGRLPDLIARAFAAP